MISIDSMVAGLQAHKPRRIPGRRWVQRCGVVLLIAEQGSGEHAGTPTVLMMRRAERAGDPWSGDVSFPGGRADAEDASTRAAALRELHEETGFDPRGRVRAIGRLSDLLTKEHGRPLPMVISPYVYCTARELPLTPSIEATELWWVPLSYFVAPDRRKTIKWQIAGLTLPVPSLDLGGARLWGLSLMMAKELVRASGLDKMS